MLGKTNYFFPIDIIKMATINGAKALGYDNIGLIKKDTKQI